MASIIIIALITIGLSISSKSDSGRAAIIIMGIIVIGLTIYSGIRFNNEKEKKEEQRQEQLMNEIEKYKNKDESNDNEEALKEAKKTSDNPINTDNNHINTNSNTDNIDKNNVDNTDSNNTNNNQNRSNIESQNNEDNNHDKINASDYSDNLFILPESDVRKINEEDLNGLSAKELTYARNEIYARYGYVFNANELNEYFNGLDWYYPDPSFDGKLPKLEQKNANFIKKYQQENELEYVPS